MQSSLVGAELQCW